MYLNMICVAQRGHRMGVEVCNLCFEIGWMPDVVVVEERNDLAARDLEATVAGTSRTAGPLHRQDPYPGTLRVKPRGSRINRTVIHNDNLEISEALTVHSCKRTPELLEPISRRHHHRDTRCHNEFSPWLAGIGVILVAERLGIAERNPARFATSHKTKRPSSLAPRLGPLRTNSGPTNMGSRRWKATLLPKLDVSSDK